MRNLSIILILLLYSSTCFSQNKGELAVNFIYGLILSNKLGGTHRNYQDYGLYSGINLKCNSNNGFQLGYQQSIMRSEWFFRGDFERRWLTYNSTLYSTNFSTETKFNKIKDVKLKNQYSMVKIGAGRRFSFFDSKLNWDVSIDMAFQIYDEKRVGFLDTIDYYEVANMEKGEFDYRIELDYTDYNKQIKFSLQNSLKYFPKKNFGINIYTSWTEPLSGLYGFSTLTNGGVEGEGSTSFTHLLAGESADLGRVITKFITFGLGVSYRFGD